MTDQTELERLKAEADAALEAEDAADAAWEAAREAEGEV
jgi:membrane protein involved in colicin uptake